MTSVFVVENQENDDTSSQKNEAKASEFESEELPECVHCNQKYPHLIFLMMHMIHNHYLDRFKELFEMSKGVCLLCSEDEQAKSLMTFSTHVGIGHRIVLNFLPEGFKRRVQEYVAQMEGSDKSLHQTKEKSPSAEEPLYTTQVNGTEEPLYTTLVNGVEVTDKNACTDSNESIVESKSSVFPVPKQVEFGPDNTGQEPPSSSGSGKNENVNEIIKKISEALTHEGRSGSDWCEEKLNDSKQMEVSSKAMVKFIYKEDNEDMDEFNVDDPKPKSTPSNEQRHRNGESSRCDKVFKNDRTLSQHTKRHHGTGKERKGHACDLCRETVHSAYALQRHMVKFHPDDSKYLCNICGKLLPDKDKLQIHIMTHFAPEERKDYRCSVCNIVLHGLEMRQRHEQTHREGETLKCEICYKEYKYEHSFRAHMKTHKNETSSCPLCPAKLMSLNSLRRHLKRVHSNCHCDICGKEFKDKETLRRHKCTHVVSYFRRSRRLVGIPEKMKDDLTELGKKIQNDDLELD